MNKKINKSFIFLLVILVSGQILFLAGLKNSLSCVALSVDLLTAACCFIGAIVCAYFAYLLVLGIHPEQTMDKRYRCSVLGWTTSLIIGMGLFLMSISNGILIDVASHTERHALTLSLLVASLNIYFGLDSRIFSPPVSSLRKK